MYVESRGDRPMIRRVLRVVAGAAPRALSELTTTDRAPAAAAVAAAAVAAVVAGAESTRRGWLLLLLLLLLLLWRGAYSGMRMIAAG